MGSKKDVIRTVLTKAVQDKYNLGDCPGLVLSLVLERRKIQFLLSLRKGALIGSMISCPPDPARGATSLTQMEEAMLASLCLREDQQATWVGKAGGLEGRISWGDSNPTLLLAFGS
jgi:hypothetical protein